MEIRIMECKKANRTWLIWVVALAMGSGGAAGLRAQRVVIPGITQPILDSTLGAPVAGIVAVRSHQEGDFVKQGEVLLELDKRLEELEARRRELVLAPMKTDLEGDRHLFQSTGSVSKQDLEKKETDYRVAVVEADAAKEQLRKRSISAPFDGYVTQIFLEIGEACQVQQPLVRIVDPRRCYFITNLEERLGHGLKTGQEVNLEVAAGSETTKVRAKIVFVSPVVDPASGLMRVKAVFENPNGRIRPGVAGNLLLEETNAH